MRVLLIEDEPNAARQLKEMILAFRPGIRIEAVIDSVEEARAWFESGQEADLVFVDIHLSDGLAFEIFESVENFVPVIFTTAYDEYAIKAFKVNGIDYLLKPIDTEDLKKSN